MTRKAGPASGARTAHVACRGEACDSPRSRSVKGACRNFCELQNSFREIVIQHVIKIHEIYLCFYGLAVAPQVAPGHAKRGANSTSCA